jgi:hypothetical protein
MASFASAAAPAPEEDEEDVCLDDYACREPYNKNEVYSQNSEYYLAGMIVCVYLHGIIYKDQIIKLLTKCILVQSASNMKDYGFNPSREMINFIMSNGDGSKRRIDEIKHIIRDMEHEKFADTFSKEQFTCTTQEVCKSVFELYKECEKYDESQIKYIFDEVYEKLIDANVIDTHEIKETIKKWVDEIREAMVSIINEKRGLSGGMFGVRKSKDLEKSERFVNGAKVDYPDRGRSRDRNIGESGTRSRTRSVGKSIDESRSVGKIIDESHQELEAQQAQQLQEPQLRQQAQELEAQQAQQLQELQLQQQPQTQQTQQLQLKQQAQKERFITYLRKKQQYLLTEFAKNNRKYYDDGNEDLSTETPKRHLTYDGAAGLPHWSFGGRQAGEDSDNYRGLMIKSCEGSHLEFFFEDNKFNPRSEEEFILRNGNDMHHLLAQLGKTCFYISDDENDESENKRTYNELLEEMSRNYDMDPLTPVKRGKLPSPYQTDMLRVCGFINYVRFLATRYYQRLHGIAFTPYLEFIKDSSTMKAYVYVFSCSKIEEGMCSFTGSSLERKLTNPKAPSGGSKTRRKKTRNKHSRKSRKRSNSLIRKIKRKPRK